MQSDYTKQIVFVSLLLFAVLEKVSD